MGMPSNTVTYPTVVDGVDFHERFGFGAKHANQLKSAHQIVQNRLPRGQLVSVDSSGTTTFTPTYDHTTPGNVFLAAKNPTAHAMLAASCVVSVLSANQITLTHGTGGADGSAYATIFYS